MSDSGNAPDDGSLGDYRQPLVNERVAMYGLVTVGPSKSWRAVLLPCDWTIYQTIYLPDQQIGSLESSGKLLRASPSDIAIGDKKKVACGIPHNEHDVLYSSP